MSVSVAPALPESQIETMLVAEHDDVLPASFIAGTARSDSALPTSDRSPGAVRRTTADVTAAAQAAARAYESAELRPPCQRGPG